MSTRKYTGKDAEMLIAISTIIENAVAHKTFLQSKRSTWADPFFTDIQAEINDTIQNGLGIDSAKDLRAATVAVTGVQQNAVDVLAEFKTQFIEDFKKDKARRDELLNQLGFKEYHKDAQRGDQEAMINLLYKFKTNMTPALQAEIIANGTDAGTITTITGYADTLKNANVSQETFKGSRKTVTAEILSAFNNIYEKTISVAKISSRLFKGQPEIMNQFSYRKILKGLNKQAKKPKKPSEPVVA